MRLRDVFKTRVEGTSYLWEDDLDKLAERTHVLYQWTPFACTELQPGVFIVRCHRVVPFLERLERWWSARGANQDEHSGESGNKPTAPDTGA